MQISITIPDEMVDQIASGSNYKAQVKSPQGDDIDNPISKADYLRNMCLSLMQNQFVRGAQIAAKAAVKTAIV